ncbi:PD-(D/E)XK nuclease family protein [Crossiella sp. CA-258035]|uniref:PD-(D/E)XK nuclease family protein n=1 Tax=Crossiella sp. CA-258035 TaxID=2981138 RepID=UPI0024BCF7C5|nr:PD-(D/E)XK nuclease family protein [Crossiella sp. CA-258035]WHT22142.1 PD-(D/E)XK nuclease family protein [Crossiella sp. CA-258035]
MFGAMSPVAEQLLEWTVEQVRERARVEVAPRLIAIVDGSERRAGGGCAECSLVAGCDALPAADLLPDVPASRGSLRSLSVTDLRYYRTCPARYHLLRQLRIREVGVTENQAIAVGRAVDTTLRNRHSGGSPLHRCAPGQPLDDAVIALPEASRHTAVRMLDQHSTLCPYPDVEAYRGEPRNLVVVHDERLGVVFVGAPDFLYPRSGGWVWRETKTAGRRLPRNRPLLREVPQLALAVLMLASGALGRDITRSRVELEQLRSDGCALEQVDPGNPAVLAEAREVIGELVRPMLTDIAYEPSPGRECASCEARRWCPPGSRHVAEQAGVPLSGR